MTSDKVDELKALYFRMHAALKLAMAGTQEMKAYEDQGVDVPRSKGCDLLCKLMVQDHTKVSTSKIWVKFVGVCVFCVFVCVCV